MSAPSSTTFASSSPPPIPSTVTTALVAVSSAPSPSSPVPPGVSLQAQLTLIAYCYALPVICVIGIIGNITNLITLASRRLRAVSYMYLRALAVADLLCMLFVLLFVSGEIVQRAGVPMNQSKLFGIYQAHFMLSLINWALATGVLVVVALSLERFVSIVFPMHFRVWNSPQRATKAIAAAYIIPGMLYIPYGIGRYTVAERSLNDGVFIYSAIDSEASKTVQWQVYKWTREGVLRFAPILILSVLNLQIMTAFRKRQRMFARLTKRKENTTNSKDDTLVYILGGIVAMFFICNIPAAINLLFINETVKQRVDYQIFRAVANLLEITNHASQFYVFCACSQDYRVTFLQKFPCFNANYTNRTRLKSIMRRVPTALSPSAVGDGSAQMQPQVSGAGVSKDEKMESQSTERRRVGSGVDGGVLQREDTVDVQLASGEEDGVSNGESDSLLQFAVGSEHGDTGGITYL